MCFFAVSQQCFGDDRIFGRRELQVRPFAFAEKYSFPGQFDYRSVVGEFGPVFRFVGAAQQLGAEPVQAIGNKFILYRQAEDVKKRRIELPRK